MVKLGAYFGQDLRKAIAVALLCVFVFKALAPAGMMVNFSAQSGPDGAVITSIAFGSNCQNEHGDGRSTPTTNHHMDCCVLCEQDDEGRHILPFLGALQIIAGLLPRDSARPARPAAAQEDIPPGRQWLGTACSPTAPPGTSTLA